MSVLWIWNLTADNVLLLNVFGCNLQVSSAQQGSKHLRITDALYMHKKKKEATWFSQICSLSSQQNSHIAFPASHTHSFWCFIIYHKKKSKKCRGIQYRGFICGDAFWNHSQWQQWCMGSKKHRGTYQEKILHLKIFPKNISSVWRSHSKSGRMRRHSHSPKASWSTACREVAAKLTTKTWLAVTSADPAMPKAWEILLQVARMSSWPKRDGAGQLVWKAASKTEKSIALQGGCKMISQSMKEVRERFQEKNSVLMDYVNWNPFSAAANLTWDAPTPYNFLVSHYTSLSTASLENQVDMAGFLHKGPLCCCAQTDFTSTLWKTIRQHFTEWCVFLNLCFLWATLAASKWIKRQITEAYVQGLSQPS